MTSKIEELQHAITAKMIDRLESGELQPWVCPWIKSGEQCIPYNYHTKNSYNGINIMILWMEAAERGYSHNSWLTFKQAKELGGHIRKGEKSVPCVFASQVEVKDHESESEDGKRKIFCYRVFSLFNIEQVEGIEISNTTQPVYDENEVVDKINGIANEYCEKTGLFIRNGGNRAYYSPTLDMIKLPITFNSGLGYAATLAHELIHSTGHKKRLNRFEEMSGNFGDFNEEYAAEELVAEVGSQILKATLGIESDHEQHASYIGSWLRHLKNDNTFIFKAASSASKAVHFILGDSVSTVSKAA